MSLCCYGDSSPAPRCPDKADHRGAFVGSAAAWGAISTPPPLPRRAVQAGAVREATRPRCAGSVA